MIRSILVPIDGSNSSKSAMSIACSVAGLADARLLGLFVQDQSRFMHVTAGSALAGSLGAATMTDQPLPPDEMLEVEEEVEGESLELYEAFQASCDASRIRSRFFCRRGDPSEEIINASKAVDFVIIGNSGKHSREEESGYTTNSVLRGTTRPVLVVPDEPEGAPRIVVAYDGSVAAERVLRAAAEFATVTRMTDLHLLTVSDNEEKAEILQRSAAQYLSSYEIAVTKATVSGPVADSIVKYSTEVDASVIALGAFGTNKFVEKIFGSTTLSILEKSQAAVLLTS